MTEPMPCEQCEDEFFGEPALLNIHGMVASKDEPACWGHSYEDNWWPCQRKAAEEHALVEELLAACKLAAPVLVELAKGGRKHAVLPHEIAAAETITVAAREIRAAIADAEPS